MNSPAPISVRLTPELDAKVRRHAEEMGESVAVVIRQAIRSLPDTPPKEHTSHERRD